MEDIIIYPKKGRMIFLGLISILFILIGVWFIFVGVDESEALAILFGLFFIAVFGACLVVFYKNVFKPAPALKLTDEGIVQPTRLGMGLIKWEEIESVEKVRLTGQLLLGIYTYDKKLIINRSTGLMKLLNNMNRGLTDTQAALPVKNFNYPVDDLLAEIDMRMHQHMQDQITEVDLSE